MRRELVTIGDVGAFEWSDLVHPRDLLTDAEVQFPFLAKLLHATPPEQTLPAVPAWAVLTVAGCAVVVVGAFITRPRSNPRRRRRK